MKFQVQIYEFYSIGLFFSSNTIRVWY
uniref:Uncharacterized protein n=1 Tax=Arundo donax TaxID=35708 RepID=A0A0A8YW06_ARUDO